jgi:hypothetical protein
VIRLCDGLLEAQIVIGGLSVRDEQALSVYEDALAQGFDLVEVETKGASFRQGSYVGIAGDKDEDGKHALVGVTLRCEPSNVEDRNAVRVEVMGQLLGYVERHEAAVLGPLLQANCSGVIEARGLIVGGWKRAESEGTYGIRVWLTSADMKRLGRPIE